MGNDFAPIPPVVYDEHSDAMQASLQEKGFFTREIAAGTTLWWSQPTKEPW